jgi:hypothetical protein
MAGGVTAAQAAPLRFEQTFADVAEPPALHFEAVYVAQGAVHRLEVWRDGQHRLKRRTDDAIETFVTRSADGTEFQMVLVDLVRHRSTRIDRTSLYRVGNFTDWYDLAHGLRHPKADYQLIRAAAPHLTVRPIGACVWYDLTQNAQTTHVCWSHLARLPLQIIDANDRQVWNVTRLDTRRLDASIFVIHDAGFVHTDASADLERD